jgi:hypothetical protein
MTVRSWPEWRLAKVVREATLERFGSSQRLPTGIAPNSDYRPLPVGQDTEMPTR